MFLLPVLQSPSNLIPNSCLVNDNVEQNSTMYESPVLLQSSGRHQRKKLNSSGLNMYVYSQF